MGFIIPSLNMSADGKKVSRHSSRMERARGFTIFQPSPCQRVSVAAPRVTHCVALAPSVHTG